MQNRKIIGQRKSTTKSNIGSLKGSFLDVKTFQLLMRDLYKLIAKRKNI